MAKKTSLILILPLLLTFVMVIPAATQGFQFGLRPEDPSIGYFEFQLNPGDTIEDAFLAFNNSDEEQLLDISVVDGHTALTGGLAFPGDANGPAEWIDLPNAGHIRIPAMQSIRLPFTLTVPEDTPPGEYASGFLIAPADLPESEKDNQTYSVKVVPQMALSVIITIPGTHECQVTVQSVIPGTHKGGWMVTIHMENTGNVHFKGSGEFSLDPSSGGNSILRKKFDIGYFVAGDQMDYPLYLQLPPPAGTYDAYVSLQGEDCSFETSFSQNLEVTVEEEEASGKESKNLLIAQATAVVNVQSQPEQTGSSSVSILLPLIILAILLMIALIVFIALWRSKE
jgi:hypothetical protein